MASEIAPLSLSEYVSYARILTVGAEVMVDTCSVGSCSFLASGADFDVFGVDRYVFRVDTPAVHGDEPDAVQHHVLLEQDGVGLVYAQPRGAGGHVFGHSQSHTLSSSPNTTTAVDAPATVSTADRAASMRAVSSDARFTAAFPGQRCQQP